MPIIIKNPNAGQLEEYLMLELQGDLENRYDDVKDCSGCFAGDILYNKFGHPILVIGHHIMYGTERKLEKPFAVIEKVERVTEANHDESVIADSQPNMSFSILDSTVNIENRTKSEVEYHVRALIKKKLVFNQRPRPIINTSSTAKTA